MAKWLMLEHNRNMCEVHFIYLFTHSFIYLSPFDYGKDKKAPCFSAFSAAATAVEVRAERGCSFSPCNFRVIWIGPCPAVAPTVTPSLLALPSHQQ